MSDRDPKVVPHVWQGSVDDPGWGGERDNGGPRQAQGGRLGGQGCPLALEAGNCQRDRETSRSHVLLRRVPVFLKRVRQGLICVIIPRETICGGGCTTTVATGFGEAHPIPSWSFNPPWCSHPADKPSPCEAEPPHLPGAAPR